MEEGGPCILSASAGTLMHVKHTHTIIIIKLKIILKIAFLATVANIIKYLNCVEIY